MTNSKRDPNFRAQVKEHHVSRTGDDPRGLEKKGGAGNHNWGKLGDQEGIEVSPPVESKLKMMDPMEFAETKRQVENADK